MKRISLVLLPLLLIGCDGMVKKADNALPIRQEEYRPVGEYVYIQEGLFTVEVHTDLHCYKIGDYSNPDRVKVSDFNHTHIDSCGHKRTHEYCRYCVSDEQYEWLVARDTVK